LSGTECQITEMRVRTGVSLVLNSLFIEKKAEELFWHMASGT
jgi:hypothetical protein